MDLYLSAMNEKATALLTSRQEVVTYGGRAEVISDGDWVEVMDADGILLAVDANVQTGSIVQLSREPTGKTVITTEYEYPLVLLRHEFQHLRKLTPEEVDGLP